MGPNPPQLVHAYIELTPFDLVKYEVDVAAIEDYNEMYEEE